MVTVTIEERVPVPQHAIVTVDICDAALYHGCVEKASVGDTQTTFCFIFRSITGTSRSTNGLEGSCRNGVVGDPAMIESAGVVILRKSNGRNGVFLAGAVVYNTEGLVSLELRWRK
jgi:hypothetical protein